MFFAEGTGMDFVLEDESSDSCALLHLLVAA